MTLLLQVPLLKLIVPIVSLSHAVAKIAYCQLRMHIKACSSEYPGTDIKKFPVPSEFVDWEKAFPEYNPVNYTAKTVLDKPRWADPEIR